ncbi:MAG TPA: M13 family metallopeptidase [Myxococcaceae bacterium]|nr:M13 family metallopeptidase [Myxococcaceae bacterium]
MHLLSLVPFLALLGSPATPASMTLAQSGIVPEWMNRQADPCVDFFEYSCGGFTAKQEIPADRPAWGATTMVQQEAELFLKDMLEKAAQDPGNDPVKKKLGDYWAACMDEPAIEKAGTAPLKPYLDLIRQVKDLQSARRAVMALHADGIYPFFDSGQLQDYADATQVIAALDQAGLGLPDRKYYLEDAGNIKAVRAAYQEHVGRMFALLGKSPADVKVAVADVLRIENALAKLQQDEVVRREPHNVYHRIDRKGLEQQAPDFPWGEYLKEMGIADVTAITVHDPAYYPGVTRLMAQEKPPAIRSYLTWTVLHGAASILSKAFVDEDFKLKQALTGIKALSPRWRRCVARTDTDLGLLLAQPYVAARFAGDSKQRATELTKSVLSAMNVSLDSLPWMDAPTRAAAKTKLGKMGYLVGYPERWRAYDFEVGRQSYAANVLAAARFEHRRQFAKIGKPVDRTDWLMTPPTVNAYYDASLNQLALPAGQLQPPFFGATFHPAVNFGSTGGGTIGHEMTHGFDDEGRQFDADGNLKNWWSEQTGKAFDAATQCVVDQYSKYEAVPGVHLNGKLTAGENIADIGGVKLGFEAYQAYRAKQKPAPAAKVEGLTDDQLYFLAYGQSWCAKLRPEYLEMMAHTNPHSPPKLRVNGVIVDQPGFGPAFSCKAGTPMNPGKACSVW